MARKRPTLADYKKRRNFRNIHQGRSGAYGTKNAASISMKLFNRATLSSFCHPADNRPTLRDFIRRAVVLCCCAGFTVQLTGAMSAFYDQSQTTAMLSTTDWMTRKNVEKGIKAYAWVKAHRPATAAHAGSAR